MGGTAPTNQLRLSFTGSEDGEAETATCRAAKPLWRTRTRTTGPQGLNLLNRRMRTRLSGGVGGCVKKTRKRHAVRKMKAGPSESPCRGRLQTAVSCFSQKLRW